MRGELLPVTIKKRITEILVSMDKEDPQTFSSVVQSFSPLEVEFVTTLFCQKENQTYWIVCCRWLAFGARIRMRRNTTIGSKLHSKNSNV